MIRTATSPSSDILKPTVTRALVRSRPSILVSLVMMNARFSGGFPSTARLMTILPGGSSTTVPETNCSCPFAHNVDHAISPHRRTTFSHTTISSLVDADELRLKNELRIIHSKH